MEPALKFVFLSFFVYLILIGFYRAYKFCNDKITGSTSGWELLGFSLLLIITNIVLLVGGLYALVEAFRFLT
jgi:hypothetical protein